MNFNGVDIQCSNGTVILNKGGKQLVFNGFDLVDSKLGCIMLNGGKEYKFISTDRFDVLSTNNRLHKIYGDKIYVALIKV